MNRMKANKISEHVYVAGEKDPPYTPGTKLMAKSVCETWNYVLKQMGKDISLRWDEVLELLTVAQLVMNTLEEDE